MKERQGVRSWIYEKMLSSHRHTSFLLRKGPGRGCWLRAQSSELREKPLPFSFKFIKNEFINTKEFTYCYVINSACFNTDFLLALKNLPEIP
jgi:hypothetical protein